MILTTHTIIYVGYNITKEEQKNLLLNRYMETSHNIRIKSQFPPIDKKDTKPSPFFSKLSKNEFNKLFKEYNLAYPEISYSQLKEKADLLSSDNNWEMYEHEGNIYFYRDDGFDFMFIKDNIKVTNKTIYFVFLTILLNITFLLFYLFLINKLSPLNRLKTNIQKFSKGNLDIDTSCNGKDEISEVSNEFNKAIKEIKQLSESRNLFLRNIMHELKTPITKGKLIESLIEEKEYKKLLSKVFERLEYLLHEFAKIEQITSNNVELNKDKYRLVDIIDQALDILMIEKNNITLNVKSNFLINVDFYLFSLVLKNLIDNAFKYGNTKPIIDIEENYISISSEGKKLEKDFKEYLKPFSRKYETSTHSLGLGLYIIETILKLHELNLQYKYENNKNIFYIKFI